MGAILQYEQVDPRMRELDRLAHLDMERSLQPKKRVSTLRQDVLRRMEGERDWSPAIKAIMVQVADQYHVSIAELAGDSAERLTVIARRAAMIELRLKGFALTQIGRVFGKHHTTVLYHMRSIRLDDPDTIGIDLSQPDLSGEWAI
jgi:chromosomal replication initiation ATPase DnaA